jgi:hypothetical protein
MTDRMKLRIGWGIATIGLAIWLFADLSHSYGLRMLGAFFVALGFIGFLVQMFLSRIGNYKP